MLDSQYEIAVATEAAWKESVDATRAMKKAGMVNEAGLAQTEALIIICTTVLDLKSKSTRRRIHWRCCWLKLPHEIQRGKLGNQQLPENFSVGVPCRCFPTVPMCMAQNSRWRRLSTPQMPPVPLYLFHHVEWQRRLDQQCRYMIVNPGKFLASTP